MQTRNKQLKKNGLLAEFLKEKRVKVSLTQMEVAEILGYSSPQFISNWERGLSSPPINTLKRLCSLYKVGQEEMFDKLLSVTLSDVTSDLRRKFFKRS